MSRYVVVLIGQIREQYLVEADSAEEARANWADVGELISSEGFDYGVDDVRLDDD